MFYRINPAKLKPWPVVSRGAGHNGIVISFGDFNYMPKGINMSKDTKRHL